MGDPTRAAAVDEMSLRKAMRRFIELNVSKEFLAEFGAHAIAITRRKKGPAAQRTPDLALTFYVRPGLKPRRHGVVPTGVRGVEPVIQFTDPETGATTPIPTDVVEEDIATAQKSGNGKAAKPKPVAGGAACIAEPRPGQDPVNGTAGGWVWDAEDSTFVILSNMHVLGEDAGRQIYHPSYASRKVLGSMKRGAWEVEKGSKTLVDCALVQVNDPERALFSVPSIGGAVMATGDADEALEVQKVGDATGRTTGVVVDAEWHGLVKNPMTHEERMFFDCLKIEPTEDEVWSKDGDSGSLVFARDRSSGPRTMSRRVVVGLHMAGDPRANKWGVACRISNVFRALNLSTIPEGLLNDIVDRALGGPLPAGTPPALMEERKAERKAMIDLAMAFADRCHTASGGKGIMAKIDANHEALVTILARRAVARAAVADVMRRMFFGRAAVADVEALYLDKSLMAAIRKAADVLIDASPAAAKKSLGKARGLLPRAGKITMKKFLDASP